MEYIQYTPEELASLESFQGYAAGKDPEAAAFWENWVAEYPAKADDVAKAKELLHHLTFRSQVPSARLVADRNRLEAAILAKASSPSSSPIVHRNIWWSRLGIAAAVSLLLLVASVFVVSRLQDTGDHGSLAQAQIIWDERAVPNGQKLTFTLSDGSKIKLNSGSVLRYPRVFSDTLREVMLSGEAFFEVTEDVTRPFVVRTEQLTTRVLGTSFNINAYPASPVSEVALLTGKVQVNHLGNTSESVILSPKQRTEVKKDGKLTVSRFEPRTLLGWKDGVLVFEKANLEQIAEKLERWYNVKIDLDPQLSDEVAFSGEFKNQSLAQVMNGLSFALQIRYETLKGNTLIIKKINE